MLLHKLPEHFNCTISQKSQKVFENASCEINESRLGMRVEIIKLFLREHSENRRLKLVAGRKSWIPEDKVAENVYFKNFQQLPLHESCRKEASRQNLSPTMKFNQAAYMNTFFATSL